MLGWSRLGKGKSWEFGVESIGVKKRDGAYFILMLYLFVGMAAAQEN
jgi:hypothetical protein